MEFIYNVNNRLQINDASKKVSVLNQQVLDKIKPTIDNEIYSQQNYNNKYDTVTAPMPLPMSSNNSKQLFYRNFF